MQKYGQVSNIPPFDLQFFLSLPFCCDVQFKFSEEKMVLAMVKNNGVQLNKEICGWKLVFFSVLVLNCTEKLNAVSLVDDSLAPQYAAKVGGRLSEKVKLMIKYKDNIFQNHIFQTYFLAL